MGPDFRMETTTTMSTTTTTATTTTTTITTTTSTTTKSTTRRTTRRTTRPTTTTTTTPTPSLLQQVAQQAGETLNAIANIGSYAAQFGAITAPIYLLFGGRRKRALEQNQEKLVEDEIMSHFNTVLSTIKDHKDKD